MKQQAWACKNKNQETRRRSSSGGIYSLLAEEVLKENGVVYAAAYDNSLGVRHIKVQSIDELSKTYGAKYCASDISFAFKDISEELSNNKTVLFVGTPCQIYALKMKYKNNEDQLICVDFICHGVPSYFYWKQYLESIKRTNNLIIKNVNMRCKKTGWSYFDYCWEFVDDKGKQYYQLQKKNLFMKSFVKGICLQESCYQCKYKGLERHSDISLGDCWGIWKINKSFDDNKGISLLLVNTEKGDNIFRKIAERIDSIELTDSSYVKYNPSINNRAVKPSFYSEFKERLETEDFQELVAEYLNLRDIPGLKTEKQFLIEVMITKIKTMIKKEMKL